MEEYTHSGQSVLVNNMQAESAEMELFPVLIGNEIANFHNVRGGYNRNTGHDVVNLVHEVQGPDSPFLVDTDQLSHEVEAHLSDNYYHFSVDSMRQVGDYPDEAHVLSMKVSDYQFGEFSFSEELSKNIDNREEVTR